MPMAAATQQWSGAGLVPLYHNQAIEQAINLAPSTVFPKGTLLGPVTSSVNDVQTVTLGGSATGGTFTYTGVNPFTGASFTVNPAFNASTAAVQALLASAAGFGIGNVVVTGTAGTTYTITGAGALAGQPIAAATVSATGMTGGTPTATIAHTTIGRTAGTYAAYASGNSNGTQIPGCILRYDCVTDGNGLVYQGNTAGASEWGAFASNAPAFFCGYFRCEDLVGLDTNAVGLTPPRFVLINGTVTKGIVKLL